MKNTLDEILEHYEKKGEIKELTSEKLSDASYELTEYLIGSGNVQHLNNYYDIVGWNQSN